MACGIELAGEGVGIRNEVGDKLEVAGEPHSTILANQSGKGLSMRIRSLLFALAIALLSVGRSYAADIKCRDVISLAEVDYPPGIAVTTTSSSGPERFCRFSINGYVADSKAPLEFKNKFGPFSKTFQTLIYSGTLTGEFIVKALPYLLFSADSGIDMKLVFETSAALDKNRSSFTKCYDEFFSKGTVEPLSVKFEDITLGCSSEESENQIQAKVTVSNSPIIRVTYISR